MRDSIAPAVVAKAQEMFAQVRRKQQAFEAAHGKSRPIITLEHQDYRFVAVGNELHFAKAEKTKFFPDFLGDYARSQLGVDWGNSEIKKRLEERHQILKWYDSHCRYQQRIKPEADGSYRGKPSGAMLSWYRLAYDLYLIKHNATLQTQILGRLRHGDQFQGARFELCVTATMVVAGFEINYEDEADTTRKHAEFIAKRTSGLVVAVEAKSRHRDGVLGFRSLGAKVSDKIAVEGLLRAALAKEPELPYFVFVDVNLPSLRMPVGEDNPWFKELTETLGNLVREWEPGTFPVSAVFFCNDPSHYTPDDELESQQFWCYGMPTKQARYPVDGRLVQDICHAAMQRCNIPNEFPKDAT